MRKHLEGVSARLRTDCQRLLLRKPRQVPPDSWSMFRCTPGGLGISGFSPALPTMDLSWDQRHRPSAGRCQRLAVPAAGGGSLTSVPEIGFTAPQLLFGVGDDVCC